MLFLFHLFLPLAFFALLLSLGARLWGAKLGSPARGAMIPLLATPVFTDWIRFIFPLPFGLAWIIALALVVVASWAYYVRSGRPPAPWQWQSSRWRQTASVLILLHILVRLWLFTGSLTFPADDVFGGYKTSALYHASGWFTPHPEVPEIAFSYYYYPYSWAAGLAYCFGLPFTFGWWSTAVVLCAMGGMLVMELILPRLRPSRDRLLALLIVVNGAAFSWLIPLATGLGPKDWNWSVRALMPRSLYFQPVQQLNGFWGPFTLFCTGGLIVGLWLYLRSLRRPFSPVRMFFLSLILGSLAGYCTFFLLGWVLIVLPVLFWSLWRFCSPAVFRRALLILTGIGLLALLLGWPILQEMLSRDSVVRDARFRPLLTWLSAPPIPLSFWLLAKMTSLIIVSCLFGNPLAILAWCSRRQIALSPLIFSVCTGIFLWGSLVACLGVVNDFVPKFGFFIALCGAFPLAFLRVRSRLINGFILGGLVGPLILLANMPRASLMLAKASPIAQVLDQQLDRENRPVLYIIGLEERIRRTPWLNYMPHNSRALFFVEAAELEDQGKNFLKSPRELPMLPPLESRLMNYFGQHTSYYLLTTPDRTREGKAPGSLLYQDRDFALFSVE